MLEKMSDFFEVRLDGYDELVFVMQGTNSIVLPDYIFGMKYLDLNLIAQILISSLKMGGAIYF